MKRISTILFCFIFPVVLFAQQTVTIDVKANVKPISPFIYGANNPTANATAIRWGGNRSTAYNWENNFSNGGQDYNDISDKYYINGLSTADQITPAIPILNTVNLAKTRSQYALVTLQAAGYVSADANGAVTTAEIAPSARWKEVAFEKPTAYSLTPDLTDNKVYIDEFVNYLTQKLGVVGNGGVDGYAIDNEASIWGDTHPLIRPTEATTDEYFYKTREIGKLVKKISPQSDVYGGVFYGWSDLNIFNKNGGNNYALWQDVKTAHGYDWFVDYYLDSLHSVEQELGQRIVDVLDLHWYPEAKGSSSNLRIVDLMGTMTDDQLITSDMINARLQAPRSLWDEAYTENSYIGTVKLLDRVQSSIDTYYPNTKIAFTEFKYDAEFHFSGGLALVDVLGVFGREGVYMASKWDPINEDFGGAAYKMYLNYDGNGSKFGSTSVKCETDNNAVLSTFASLDEQNNLHIIVVNKSLSQKTSTFSIANGFYSSAEVYGFDQTDKTVRTFAAPTLNGSSFDYTLPAYSALHFIVYAKPQIEISSAAVSSSNASDVIVSFNGDITIADATQLLQDFVVKNSSDVVLPISSYMFSATNEITLTLTNPIPASDSICKLSYSGSSITNADGTPVADLSNLSFSNESPAAPFFVLNAYVMPTGKEVVVNFSKKISSIAAFNPGLELIVNTDYIQIDSIVFDNNEYLLHIYPTQRLTKYDSVYVENTFETLYDVNDVYAPYFNVLAENYGPSISPVIDSVVIQDNFTAIAYVDSRLQATDFNSVGFTLNKDGASIPFTATYAVQRITISVPQPLFKENVYTLSYTDNSGVQTIFGGFLNSIDNAPITNRLKTTPGVTTVTTSGITKIQSEDYAYHKSTSKLEICSDVDAGSHVGFIGDNNRFGYNVTVQTAGTYTILLRHAGASQNGSVVFKVDGVTAANLFVPKSGSWNTWYNSAVTIELPVGAHTIEMFVAGSGFNANYITIESGSHPSNATISAATTDNAGGNVIIIYDRKLKVLPQISEVTVQINNQPVVISAIGYLNNDSTKLQFTTAQPFYKNQVITISYTTTSGITTENGIILPATAVSVTNKSTQIDNAINSVEESGVLISPNPAQVDQQIQISVEDNLPFSYTVSSIDGKVLISEQGVGVVTCILKQKGVYIIKVHTNTQIVLKKILVK